MTKFDTELTVRPSEIDYNRHVHQSVYLDYLLYARVDQMERCYKMPIEEFFKRGYTWATKSISIEYHKPAFMGETLVIRTWIDEIYKRSVRVRFQIIKKDREELAAEGESVYVLINVETGKPAIFTSDMMENFSV
jgi:thioesterase-3